VDNQGGGVKERGQYGKRELAAETNQFKGERIGFA